MSSFPGIILLAVSAVAWVLSFLQRERLYRWIYEAADRQFMKKPNLDVGLIFLMAFANLGIATLLVMPSILGNQTPASPSRTVPAEPALLPGTAIGAQESFEEGEIQEPAIEGVEEETPGDQATTSTESNDGAPAIRFWQSISQLLVIALMVGVAGRFYQTPLAQWGWGTWNRRQLVPTLRLGLISFLLLVPPVLFIHELLTLWVGYEHKTLDAIQVMKQEGDWRALGFTLMTTAVLVPIFEEIVFRGIFQGFAEQWVRFRDSWPRWIVGPMRPGIAEWLGVSGAAHLARSAVGQPVARRGESFWGPIIFSSLLFSLAHIGQGAAPISLYLLAMGLGWLYRQTGNLTACILVHAGLNATTLLNFLYL